MADYFVPLNRKRPKRSIDLLQNHVDTVKKSVSSSKNQPPHFSSPHFLKLVGGVLDYVGTLEQSVSDIDVVLGTTVKHSSTLENDLQSKQSFLRDMRQRYEFIANTSQDWMCIVNKDHKLEAINDAFCKACRVLRESLIGESIATLWQRNKTFKFIETFFSRAFEGQDIHQIEWVVLGKERFCLDIWCYPFHSDKGVLTHVVFVARDITERQLAKNTVKEQSAFLDKARDAIFVQDHETRIRYWNKASERLYGVKRKDAIGKKVSELMFKSQFDKKFVHIWDRVTMDGEWNGEINYVNKNGRSVVVDSRWTLLEEDPTAPNSILVINTDITEKKSLEMQFYRAQRMESIGMLASGIAHDLNNVLSPFFLAIRALETKMKDAQSKTILSLLDASAKRGAKLVKQILAFARGLDEDYIHIKLTHLVTEIEGIVRETFPKNISFSRDIEQALWTIKGDATQLHQVFLNLCVNARDAMKNGGRITISGKNISLDKEHVDMEGKPVLAGEYVLISVKDEGEGMSEKVMSRIFEPFFTTKKRGKGTGLGLSTVLSIMKNHAGFLQVDSQHKKGSDFRLFFPAITTKLSSGTRDKENVLPSGNGETILFVDDDKAIRNISKAMLETYGYRVLLAKDGKEAVSFLVNPRVSINLAVVDLEMPVMDGNQTISHIRDVSPDMPVVAMSGLEIERTRPSLSDKINKESFLLKPLETSSLLNTVYNSLYDELT